MRLIEFSKDELPVFVNADSVRCVIKSTDGVRIYFGRDDHYVSVDGELKAIALRLSDGEVKFLSK